MSNGDADDPSLEEISAFLDGETVAGLTSEKLDSLSESNPELYQKVAEMHSVKLTLDNFLSAKNLTVTNEIKEKVLSLVKDKVSLDDDELIDENELLVSSYIDGEVSAEEAIEAEKLIAESDYYRSIYEAHSDAKNKVASLINEKKTKPKLLSNRFIERFLPLAAVFVFGAILSPFVLDQSFLRSDKPGITLRGGSSDSETYSNMVDFTTKSNIQHLSIYYQDDSQFAQREEILPTETKVSIAILPPFSGRAKIYIMVSENAFPEPLSRGELHTLGELKQGEVVLFPENGVYSVDNEDRQMRVDLEIENGSVKSVYTHYFKVGDN